MTRSTPLDQLLDSVVSSENLLVDEQARAFARTHHLETPCDALALWVETLSQVSDAPSADLVPLLQAKLDELESSTTWRQRMARAMPMAAGLGVAAVLALVVWPVDSAPTFREKGSAAVGADHGAQIFAAATPAATPRLVTKTLHATDSLFVRASTVAGGPRALLVCLVDETGRIHWVAPTWTDAVKRPVSVALRPGSRAVLDHGVRHPLSPGPVRALFIFSAEALDVHSVDGQIHALVEKGRLDMAGLAEIIQQITPDAEVRSQVLRVVP